MIYSKTTRYTIQALVELAYSDSNEYLTVKKLSREVDVPREFLAKIFQDLTKHGLLESRPGRGGGFRLSRPPGKIELYEIVELIEGPEPLSDCIFDGNVCHGDDPCPLHDQWIPVRDRLTDFLKNNTVADLAEP